MFLLTPLQRGGCDFSSDHLFGLFGVRNVGRLWEDDCAENTKFFSWNTFSFEDGRQEPHVSATLFTPIGLGRSIDTHKKYAFPFPCLKVVYNSGAFGGKIQAWSAVDLFWVCHCNSLAFMFLQHCFKIFRQNWGRETYLLLIKEPYAISYFTRTNMFPGIWIFTRLLPKCCWILLTISSRLLHCSGVPISWGAGGGCSASLSCYLTRWQVIGTFTRMSARPH